MRQDGWSRKPSHSLRFGTGLALLLALLPGCALIDGAARLTGRAVTELVGGAPDPPPRDPLFIHLQLAMLSDYVVTQLLDRTETPLAAARNTGQREILLRLRLDYAAEMWNAASGPNPYANAIDMLVTLAIGRKSLERPAVADALGSALRPTLDVLASADRDVAAVVKGFLAPAEYRALREAIDAKEDTSVDGHGLGTVDLQKLLATAGVASGPGDAPTSLFRVLGMDPFAGLDPATREIAESRQFGERLLFNIQRLPLLMRLNAELLSNDVSRDLEFDRMLTSLERASAAMDQVARTAAALPDRLDQERVRLLADLRAEAESLATLARDYRAAFEAATMTAAAADQTLQTFGGVMDRLQPAADQGSQPARPFDITEYARTAAGISDAATNLSGLLGRVENTLDSPGLARLAPQAAAVLEAADARGRRLLYTAFALGCGLIAFASLAVLVTASVLQRRHGRNGSATTPAS